MTPILQAAAQGYSPNEILKYIAKLFPKVAPKIAQATASGYTIDQTLKYINRLMEEDKIPKGLTSHEIEALHTKKYNELSKKILGTAATAVGSTAFVKNLPKLLQAGASALNIGPQPMGGAPIQPAQASAQPAQPLNAGGTAQNAPQQPNQPQPAQPQASPAITQVTGNSTQIINSMGIAPQIQNLAEAGNTPEAIATAVGVSLKPNQRKWLDDQIKEGKSKALPDLVADFLSESNPQQNPQQNPVTSQRNENSTASQPQEAVPEQAILEQKQSLISAEDWKKKMKGESVITPSGQYGQVESIREKEALVKDENGKLHKVEADDLISSPLPEKDLADLYDDLIKGIEGHTEEEVSKMANWAGYDPTTNTLAFLPHDGALYTYENLNPEDVAELTNILSTRKTTGENFIGVWKEGTKSPIGAAMSKLIQKLQKESGGKGKEYSHKFQTVYSALEPAIKAAKNRHRERKKNERKKQRPD
jgi:preprotein translocase subunit YajC